MITQNVVFAAGQTIKFFDNATFVRILSASATLTMRLYRNGTVISESAGVSVGFAEQHEQFFDAFEIYSATAQTIQFAARLNSIISYDQPPTGNVNVANIPHIIIDSLPSIVQTSGGQVYGASYRSITANTANVAEQIFSAASNINGAIIHAASFAEYNATTVPTPAFLAKATAPSSVVDGDIILGQEGFNFFTSANTTGGSLKNPLKIAAGKGLFYITNIAQSSCSRGVLYTLL